MVAKVIKEGKISCPFEDFYLVVLKNRKVKKFKDRTGVEEFLKSYFRI